MSASPVDAAAWGVDLSLDAHGDLALAPNGDLALVKGAENLVQALRLRLFCARGELPIHPEYGSRLNSEYVGQKSVPPFVVSAEISAEMEDLIVQDTRFIAASVTQSDASGEVSTQTIEIVAVDGTQLTVSSLPNPQLIDVGVPLWDAPLDLYQSDLDDPASADEITQASFFADESELDTLADADLLSTLADDQAGQSILP